jgi:EAL domain-containing protein (putative c-di-GMP-specific phosphodiesterase class I)
MTASEEAPDKAVTGCEACADGIRQPFAFEMAFQPIVDLAHNRIFAFEALVRGPNGEGAGSVLSRVDATNLYAFDQSCRIRAIETASEIGLVATGAALSINFIPGAVYRPETCIRATMAAARRVSFPTAQLIFEVTEGEKVADRSHLRGILEEYRRQGFRSAIDDFGAGYAGLNLLAEFQPDIIKVDMELVRDIDRRPTARRIVEAVARLGQDLGIAVLAEGIESRAELAVLRAMGIDLLQGYLFAKPGFRTLPMPQF